MMNSMKKATLLFVVFAVFIVGVVYATIWYSNIVSVEVTEGYTVTLDQPTTPISIGDPIQFTGMLEGPTVVDQSIEIWECFSLTDGSHIGTLPVATATTISDGTFSTSWTPETTGTYYFIAEYTSTP